MTSPNPAALLHACRSSGCEVWFESGNLRLKGLPAAVEFAKRLLLPHKELVIEHLLGQFRFDLVAKEIEEKFMADELDRCNDMAWEFMQRDQLPFQEAMAIAASICKNCDPAPCEAAYESARALWERYVNSKGGRQSA